MAALQHKEAFCLMWYACKCGHRERIWNSRDGVTPFSCSCPSCGSMDMSHVDWRQDEPAPNHKLTKGQRFWRDGTPGVPMARQLSGRDMATLDTDQGNPSPGCDGGEMTPVGWILLGLGIVFLALGFYNANCGPFGRRKTRGFWDGLTPEQKAAALAYRGPENHGDPPLPKDYAVPPPHVALNDALGQTRAANAALAILARIRGVAA